MEQLANKMLYKRNATTGEYDPRYIVHLYKNYRSHPDILHIPNQLFYEGRLEAKAAKGVYAQKLN